MFSQLTALLSRYPAIKLAVLFGSMVTGNARPDSDVDLGLLAEAPLTTDFKLQLIETIGAEFGRPVDIVDLYYAAEPILGQVFKVIKLYGDNMTYAKLLTRHLLNAADFLPLHQRILTERRNKWIN